MGWWKTAQTQFQSYPHSKLWPCHSGCITLGSCFNFLEVCLIPHEELQELTELVHTVAIKYFSSHSLQHSSCNVYLVLQEQSDLQKWGPQSLVPFFLVKNIKKVTQLCPTLCNPMDGNLPGSSVHGILQARILEWVAVPFTSGSSQPRNRTGVSCIAGGFFTN